MSLSCLNSPDSFYYVCGKFTSKPQKRSVSAYIQKVYLAYFGCHLGDQNRVWAPHIICTVCYYRSSKWWQGKRDSMPFGVPMIWREPKNHSDDCYFCLVKVHGYTYKQREKNILAKFAISHLTCQAQQCYSCPKATKCTS